MRTFSYVRIGFRNVLQIPVGNVFPARFRAAAQRGP
jgi:hypothetical protein